MRKKLLAILLTLAMVVTMLPAAFVTVTAEAAFTPKDDAWFEENDYTKITDAAGLKTVANNGKYYLAKDIDFTGESPVSGELWDVTLDGNGHKITVNNELKKGADWPKAGGVFEQFVNTTVKNLTVEGTLTSNDDHVNNPEIGGLVGTVDGTCVLENVVANVNITVTNESGAMVGGIIGNIANNNCGGYNHTNVTMKNCVNKGTIISSGMDVGGLVGVVLRTLKMDGCVNEGLVQTTGKDANVGGLVARTMPATTTVEGTADAGVVLEFKNCENKGTVDGNKTTSDGDGVCVGGLVGILLDTAETKKDSGVRIPCTHTYTNCANSGTVLDGVYTGGLIGRNSETYTAISFTDCANMGIVDDQDSAAGGGHWARSGGLIGLNDWATKGVTFTNCQNSGPVLGQNDSAGFIGQDKSSNLVFENCVNTATLNGKNQMAGFIGYCDSSANGIQIKNCVNYGDIVSNNRSAGFIANMKGTPELNIENCVNFGTITTKTAAQSSGTAGFIAMVQNTGKTITLKKCVNFGDVIVQNAKGYYRVSGIIGCIPDSASYTYNLESCANFGTLDVQSLSNNYVNGKGEVQKNVLLVGGMFGKVGAATVNFKNCYEAGNAIVTAPADNQESYLNAGSFYASMIGQTQASTVTATDCVSAYKLHSDNKMTGTGVSGDVTVLESTADFATAVTKLGDFFILDDGRIEPKYDLNNVETQVYATQEATKGEGETVDVRVLALVNSLGYDKAGVNLYKVGDTTAVATQTTTTVYTGVLDGAETMNAPYGTYYLPITVKGISTTGTYTFVVETFVVDGEDTIASEQYTITVTDGVVASAKKN